LIYNPTFYGVVVLGFALEMVFVYPKEGGPNRCTGAAAGARIICLHRRLTFQKINI